jgi:hypothetical protein
VDIASFGFAISARGLILSRTKQYAAYGSYSPVARKAAISCIDLNLLSHQNQQRLSRWKSSSDDEDDNDKVDSVWRSPPPHPKDDGNGNANVNGDDSDATDPPPLLLQHAVSLLEELRVMGNYLLSQDDAVVVDDEPAPFGASTIRGIFVE